MTNEELVKQIQAGIDVQNNLGLLYEQNRKIIAKWALPFTKRVEMADLMQEAYFGLDAAVKDFNNDGAVKFLTYAQFKIKSQLQRYYFNCGTTKRLPVRFYEKISKYKNFIMDYLEQYGESPPDEIIMLGLGLTKKQLAVLKKAIYEAECISIDAIIPGTDNLTIGEFVTDESNLEDDVLDRIANEQADSDLWQSVDELPEKQRQIVIDRYKNNESLQDIAKRMKISDERVRQYERAAFSILRNMKKVQDAADNYGLDSSAYYRSGLQSFKNSGTSCVERIVLKHIELDERMAKLQSMLDNLAWEY